MEKNIVCVNTFLPSLDGEIEYDSKISLSDYDIIVFDPRFPLYDRQYLSAGGSIVGLEAAKKVSRSISHWKTEMERAFQSGKTIFFLLRPEQVEQIAVSVSSTCQ